MGGSSSHKGYTEIFTTPFKTSSLVEFPVVKNTCTNFSKFRLKCLVACPGDLHATSFSHENRVFCTMRAFFRTGFKIFSFFPRISRLFILLSAFPSFKTIVFTHKISIFSFTSSPIFKERYRFCFFLNIFYILAIYLLDSVFLLISVYLMREYGNLIFR